jgi:hypothetical protein
VSSGAGHPYMCTHSGTHSSAVWNARNHLKPTGNKHVREHVPQGHVHTSRTSYVINRKNRVDCCLRRKRSLTVAALKYCSVWRCMTCDPRVGSQYQMMAPGAPTQCSSVQRGRPKLVQNFKTRPPDFRICPIPASESHIARPIVVAYFCTAVRRADRCHAARKHLLKGATVNVC